MINNNFPTVRFKTDFDQETLRQLVQSINSAMLGKINATGEVTLTPSTTSTAVTDNRCLTGSIVLLMPVTANAAAAIASTYITTGAGTFTINHANNAQTDKEFKYVILG